MDGLTTGGSSPLRIAVVIDVYDAAVRNGAVVSTRRFVQALRGRQHQVTVISTGQAERDKVVVKAVYPPFCRRILARNHLVFGWPKKAMLQNILSQVDIVHLQFPFYLSVKTIRIAKALHVPVIASFHVQAENMFYNVGVRHQTIMDASYRLFNRWVYNRCAAVICPSGFARQELRDYGLRVPSYVISNGVSSRFTPLTSPSLALTSPNCSIFTILSVGRLSPEKQHALIIQAIALSSYRDQIQLVLVGQGGQASVLEHMAGQLPVLPILEFNGIDEAQLIHYYQTADLYVHAGTIELECLSVMEAMACGQVPLIANAPKSAAKQFALDDRSLFSVHSSDAACDLAKKIDYWIANPSERDRMKSVYAQCAKQYSFDRSVDALEAIYSQYACSRQP